MPIARHSPSTRRQSFPGCRPFFGVRQHHFFGKNSALFTQNLHDFRQKSGTLAEKSGTLAEKSGTLEKLLR
ncbi:MAG: hypothetical protein J1E77_02110, partial [Prevotella sp.]|nr:hypothetical protein [Prevotella sp.]